MSSEPKPAKKRNEHSVIKLENQVCPYCHNSKDLDFQMVLYVGPCAHSICKLCLDAHFKFYSGECPKCGERLSKRMFKVQVFDDPRIDREVEIRKMMENYYFLNKIDFDSDDETYTQFLLDYENLAFTIAKKYDPEQSKESLAQFKQKYEEQFSKHKKMPFPPFMGKTDAFRRESNRNRLRLKNAQSKVKPGKASLADSAKASAVDLSNDFSRYIYKPPATKNRMLRTKPMANWRSYFPENNPDPPRHPAAEELFGKFRGFSDRPTNVGEKLGRLCQQIRLATDVDWRLSASCGYPLELAAAKLMAPIYETPIAGRLIELRERFAGRRPSQIEERTQRIRGKLL